MGIIIFVFSLPQDTITCHFILIAFPQRLFLCIRRHGNFFHCFTQALYCGYMADRSLRENDETCLIRILLPDHPVFRFLSNTVSAITSRPHKKFPYATLLVDRIEILSPTFLRKKWQFAEVFTKVGDNIFLRIISEGMKYG